MSQICWWQTWVSHPEFLNSLFLWHMWPVLQELILMSGSVTAGLTFVQLCKVYFHQYCEHLSFVCLQCPLKVSGVHGSEGLSALYWMNSANHMNIKCSILPCLSSPGMNNWKIRVYKHISCMFYVSSPIVYLHKCLTLTLLNLWVHVSLFVFSTLCTDRKTEPL